MNNKYSLYFSIFGGYLFDATEQEEKTLDAFQLPLKQKPKSSCKQCNGTFKTGYDAKQKHYIFCKKCSKTCLDVEKLLNRTKNVSTKKDS